MCQDGHFGLQRFLDVLDRHEWERRPPRRYNGRETQHHGRSTVATGAMRTSLESNAFQSNAWNPDLETQALGARIVEIKRGHR